MEILAAAARPTLFQPSDAAFWDDPHISRSLLDLHFDDSVEAASRTASTIAAAVDRLMAAVIPPGARVLDLGCGPGRYAELLAAAGCRVTGLDLSQRSIDHARARAAELGLSIEYRRQDFLTLDDVGAYEVVLQSFGELNTFGDDVRDRLLAAVRRALVPGGALVFDSSTPHHRSRIGQSATWSAEVGGFWRSGPHLVLNQGHAFPDDVWCDHYVVVDDERAVAYRMWFHDYTPATLAPVLERSGFAVEHLWEGLDGGPYAGGDWIGVVARRNDAPRQEDGHA